MTDPGDAGATNHAEPLRALIAAVPFRRDDAIRIVEIGAGDGQLTGLLLAEFPSATVTALEAAEPRRETARPKLAALGDRVRLRSFDLASLDWWDVMFGADLVVSAFCIQRLNDAKKQYLYKAAADRISPRGAFLIADTIAPMREAARADRDAHPSALFHHLVWLRHAGFAAVECVWLRGAEAVYGGFKPAAASERRPPADS